MWPLRVR